MVTNMDEPVASILYSEDGSTVFSRNVVKFIHIP
jgi:hypothetical protein